MIPRTSARRAALRALVALETHDRPLAALLEDQQLAPEARPFAREISTQTVRHRARLDAALAPLLRRPLAKLDAPVRTALRLAACERLLLSTPLNAITDQYAELMRGEKLSSAVAFVNAVARRLPEQFPPAQGNEAVRLSVEYSHPQWLIARYLSRFGATETQVLLAANNQPALLCLRVNTLQASREAVLGELSAAELDAAEGSVSPQAILVRGGGSPVSWEAWRAGHIIAQDEAAQLVGLVASPQAHDLVVDAASAPGGKTTHLAELSGDTGQIIACDVAEGRLKLVRDNAARLGLHSIETRAGDLRVLAEALPAPQMVLLDAPCLGTGTLRRRPDAKWRKTPEQLSELVSLQRELLDAAAQLVRRGGVGSTLVYSTCSLEPEENEAQARDFGARHPDFVLERPTHPALQPFLTDEGHLQTLPQRDGCDGAFAARWRYSGLPTGSNSAET